MTEDEAKTKWCPFARVIVGRLINDSMFNSLPDVAPHNRIQNSEKASEETIWNQAHNCIGSQCMAWRTDSKPEIEKIHEDLLPLWEKMGWGMIERSSKKYIIIERTIGGYCGLAGKP